MRIYYHDEFHYATAAEAIAEAKDVAQVEGGSITVYSMDVKVDKEHVLRILNGPGYATNVKDYAIVHADGNVEYV